MSRIETAEDLLKVLSQKTDVDIVAQQAEAWAAHMHGNVEAQCSLMQEQVRLVHKSMAAWLVAFQTHLLSQVCRHEKRVWEEKISGLRE